MRRSPSRGLGGSEKSALDHPETIDIRTGDGWSLRADVREPSADSVGIAVLAHAMMARRSEFERPEGAGLARFLCERGWRVVTFDFRGHGDSVGGSGADGDVRYDDFVTQDLPAVHAFARSRVRRKRPVVLVGHSLGGHVALASQGTGRVAFDGIVTCGATMWLRELEPSLRRWWLKRAVVSAMVRVTRGVGRFPARALRMGSDDESQKYFEDVGRFTRTGKWASADGKVDYLASLERVRAPVLQIVSEGDRLLCTPECGARFIERCGGSHELVRVARADDGGPAPGHMGIVTSGRIESVWARTENWMRRTSSQLSQ